MEIFRLKNIRTCQLSPVSTAVRLPNRRVYKNASATFYRILYVFYSWFFAAKLPTNRKFHNLILIPFRIIYHRPHSVQYKVSTINPLSIKPPKLSPPPKKMCFPKSQLSHIVVKLKFCRLTAQNLTKYINTICDTVQLYTNSAYVGFSTASLYSPVFVFTLLYIN